jgi:glutamine amidotransferase
VIAIIDYRAGNLASVKRALNQIGADAEITNNPSIVINAERIIFPGVGASGKAISDLKGLGLDRALVKAFDDGKPILGICLGTQIIMERSWENNTRCLGLIKGDVQRFPADLRDDKGQRLKVPHMGWNRVRIRTPHPLFEGIDPKMNSILFMHIIHARQTKNILWVVRYMALTSYQPWGSGTCLPYNFIQKRVEGLG